MSSQISPYPPRLVSRSIQQKCARNFTPSAFVTLGAYALEYLTETDPLLSGDAWSIGIGKTDQNAVIDFTRTANRRFEVQWTSDIGNIDSWQPLDLPANAPFFAATNSAVSIEDPLTNASTKFYRVRVFEP